MFRPWTIFCKLGTKSFTQVTLSPRSLEEVASSKLAFLQKKRRHLANFR